MTNSICIPEPFTYQQRFKEGSLTKKESQVYVCGSKVCLGYGIRPLKQRKLRSRERFPSCFFQQEASFSPTNPAIDPEQTTAEVSTARQCLKLQVRLCYVSPHRLLKEEEQLR